MVEHVLKCWPEQFQEIRKGYKTFEFRKNDRGFQKWDRLVLQEFDPATETYSGEEENVEVQHILSEGFGLPDGFVVMGFRRLHNGSVYP